MLLVPPVLLEVLWQPAIKAAEPMRRMSLFIFICFNVGYPLLLINLPLHPKSSTKVKCPFRVSKQLIASLASCFPVMQRFSMDASFTILILEDNQDDMNLLEVALRREGITSPVQVVRDGEEAIEYLCGNGRYGDRVKFPFPKVIFTDLKMPRMGGFEVLEWVRRHPECSVIPVIILSDSKLASDIKKAYQMGANAYLCKPARIEDMQQMVKTAFQFWAWSEIPQGPEKC